jgi:PPOX class probable F420-dependent enzyme
MPVDLAAALDFVRTHHRAVLQTTSPDGSAQLSLVVATLDAEARVIVSTRAATAKARNLRRRPFGALVVMDDTFFGPWVQLDGPVEIDDGEGVVDRLVEYYRSISGEHPDWDAYRAAMVAEGRVLLRLSPTRARGQGLPATGLLSP